MLICCILTERKGNDYVFSEYFTCIDINEKSTLHSTFFEHLGFMSMKRFILALLSFPVLISGIALDEKTTTISLKEHFHGGSIQYTYKLTKGELKENVLVQSSSTIKADSLVTINFKNEKYLYNYREETAKAMQKQTEILSFNIKNLLPLFDSLNGVEPFLGLFTPRGFETPEVSYTHVIVDGKENPFGYYSLVLYGDINLIDLSLTCEISQDGETLKEDYQFSLPILIESRSYYSVEYTPFEENTFN